MGAADVGHAFEGGTVCVPAAISTSETSHVPPPKS